MQMDYHAPWTVLLKFVTILVSCIFLATGVFLAGATEESAVRVASILLALAAIITGALFTVRGYGLRDHKLEIYRLLWITEIDLTGLAEVAHDPAALKRSLRICGNGGFFSFTGWFRSKELGVYRMFGTSLEHAVTLKFRDRRPIVVTPDRPADFVRELQAKTVSQ